MTAARTIAAIAALGALGACRGEPAKNEATTAETSAETAPAPVEAGPAAPSVAVAGGEMVASRDVVANIKAVPGLSKFAAAIDASGLARDLASHGPITVFAPTDEAFAKLPTGTLQRLMKPENRAELTALVAYHVLPGKIGTAELRRSIIGGSDKVADMTSSNNFSLQARLEGERLVLVDGNGNAANVTTTDVPQANGVLHVIDRVLAPAEG